MSDTRPSLEAARAADTPRRGYYPPIEPYRTGRLRVSDVHELYFEESGNPDGKPVIFLHPKDFVGTLVELEQAAHGRVVHDGPSSVVRATHTQ